MRSWLYVSVFFILTGLEAQITHPRISPKAITQQELGLAKIKVNYSRPSVRGRQIMGDLVPYGRIWRVGANESTKFTNSATLFIAGNELSPGTYALYAFPQKMEWEIVFHANTEHWGDGRNDYDAEEDVFRIKVVPEVTDTLKENFDIRFDKIEHNSMDMIWEWEYTRVTIPVEVDTHSLMLSEISRQIKDNPTAQTFYEAGRYLQEQGESHQKALEYLNKAIEIGGDTYYFHRVKSLLEAELGKYDKAILSARKSMELAESLGKDEFVRMNRKNISLWEEMLEQN
ncbi:MAG: DUF2911 domain-containing protein [Flavobacteriaceae bacterium]